MEVSQSGYYAWRRRPASEHARCDRALLEKIRRFYSESRCTYGSPRVYADLRANGERISLKRVARLMRNAGLHGAIAKPRRVRTTDSRHGKPVAENLLNREFAADGPNRKWVCDITYVRTNDGWLYLATVMDLYSRMIVGWAMSDAIDGALVRSALAMAIAWRQPPRELLLHSDRGSTYVELEYQQLARAWQMQISMSRKGNCYDNAVIESWHSRLKIECVRRQRYATHQEARQSIFAYIEGFYNTRRRHSTLGYLSPRDFERLNVADT